ncbi:ATP-binding protein [Zoogloea sp.]|uniref:PAS domain-containing hybrid sensor histidine kinase/response regulator n=1 Tax=Zoogloea sp. TaxID=49181 RepID=UPI0035B2EB95
MRDDTPSDDPTGLDLPRLRTLLDRLNETLGPPADGLAPLLDQQTLAELSRLTRALEARAAEPALNQQAYRAIIDSSDDAIIGKALDGTITSWNTGAERIFGYGAAEALGQSIRIIIPPERHGEESTILARIAAGERVDHFETVRCHKDGHLIDVSATVSPILDENGQVCGASKIARDITARKRTDAELAKYRQHLEAMVEERTAALSVAKEAAEAANRAKSSFLANMSHELRTPLNAIIGLSELALRGAHEPRLRDQLVKIDRASQHLLGVINDVLDISRIEADRLVLEQTHFRLGEVLENFSSLVAHRAAEKGLLLRVILAPEIARLALHGDPLRLSQILINFAGNAIKFTEHGGITVRVHLAEEGERDVALRFEVQDTGIGIAAADRDRLFNAFEQADASMTRKYGGSGLGLAISKRLVELMGGQVGVDSEEGRGSTFWFVLRIGKGQESALPRARHASEAAEQRLRQHCRGMHVLLVEDEPINQEVSRELLQLAGLRVSVAANGAEAVEAALRGRYDLILMDMQMPVLDGPSATREILARLGEQAPPIVAMTANAMASDRQCCLDAGMRDHITKPINSRLLFAKLLQWLLPAAEADSGENGNEATESPATDIGLHDIDGLDPDAALYQLGGNSELYLRVLAQFAADHASSPQRIANALAAGDRNGAQRRAHSLKGVASQAGAGRLRSLAERVEHDIRDHAPGLDASLVELGDHLSQLITALQHHLPPS